MDRLRSVVSRFVEVGQEKYPNINLLQLGTVTYLLGIMSNILGHEGSRGTMSDYIHPEGMNDRGVIKCLDFLYREILALKDSRIAIGRWHKGNRVAPRRMEPGGWREKK